MQEEEAALLSIGAVLKWKPMPPEGDDPETPPAGYVHVWARICTNKVDADYYIEFNPEFFLQVEVFMQHRLQNKQSPKKQAQSSQQVIQKNNRYNSLAEAKAACEIHAATGQFPPGVEPSVSRPKGRK